jgi:hypothetical protein
MLSVLGLETSDAVPPIIMKRQRISKDNNLYTRLIEYLDLPSLQDMAVVNAKTIIKQTAKYETKYFLFPTDLTLPEPKRTIPHGLNEAVRSPDILRKMWELSKLALTVRNNENGGWKKDLDDVLNAWIFENGLSNLPESGKMLLDFQNAAWTKFRAVFNTIDPGLRLSYSLLKRKLRRIEVAQNDHRFPLHRRYCTATALLFFILLTRERHSNLQMANRFR